MPVAPLPAVPSATPPTGPAIVAWFQPVVRLSDGVICGLDALPVDVADDGLWEAVLRQVAGWQADVLVTPGFRVTVPLAGGLGSNRPAAAVARAVHQHGLDPHGLAVQVDEARLLEDLPAARGHGLALHDLGVRLSLGGFGARYSSLPALSALPFAVVALDHTSLTSGTALGREILRGMVATAHAVGATVVATGVETAEDEAVARLLGCDEAQGRRWSPPVPATMAEALLA